MMRFQPINKADTETGLRPSPRVNSPKLTVHFATRTKLEYKANPSLVGSDGTRVDRVRNGRVGSRGSWVVVLRSISAQRATSRVDDSLPVRHPWNVLCDGTFPGPAETLLKDRPGRSPGLYPDRYSVFLCLLRNVLPARVHAEQVRSAAQRNRSDGLDMRRSDRTGTCAMEAGMGT